MYIIRLNRERADNEGETRKFPFTGIKKKKKNATITFYDLFKSIYRLSGSIYKGLTGRKGEKIAAIEVARQFSMIVLIAFIIERHLGRRIPSRLMRPTISKPWNKKKKRKKEKNGGKERNEKRKKNVAAAKGGKRWGRVD